jgi:septal ring factor EnvC (AmiA/AmiB activator)
MGVTVDAIRKRISRDTIPHERDKDGRVWVLLDTDQDASSKVRDTDQPRSDSEALISEMRDRIAHLERQLEQERQANSEHRRLLAAALERIPPQLEAPQEASEAPETAEE